jgi:uncharacterized protein (DUF2267 family)
MTTGLATFDTTVQDANLWLKEVAAHLGDADRQEAYVALRAALHALRDRLQAQAAAKFAAQLPMLVRGLYYEGWTLPDKPSAARTIADFAEAVAAELPPRYRFDPVLVSRAVFAAAATMMGAGADAKVRGQLPPGLRDLWPEPNA